jgi:diguanylate cyclase (GGDEF)-like protein
LARLPALSGQAPAAGQFRLKSKAADVELLHSAARSGKYALVADAAVSKDEVLADWRRVTWQESAAQAGEMLAVYLVCYWVIGQMRVRERLERELRTTRDALEKQNAALARLADTDGLTGLHNRRHLDARMAAEVARAARERTPLSLIMMDVDFFKRYNDAYGHAAGDDCLRMVAGVLAGTVNRPADLAARFGGEEFAVLLPNTAQDGARGIAEAICRGVHAAGMAHRASDIGVVTISAGVATLVPSPGDEVRALVEAADAALYAAKEAGRNRVCAH